jgi:hypothetical protein
MVLQNAAEMTVSRGGEGGHMKIIKLSSVLACLMLIGWCGGWHYL